MKALMLQFGATAPPGLLGEWAEARGFETAVHRVDLDGPVEDLSGLSFLACLGARWSPADRVTPVEDARRTVAAAVDGGVPVLGLCFGGQVLADVLGGELRPAPEPELGWYEVETAAPDRVAAGPWLQWHRTSFATPPGGEELASSPAGTQAFALGPHLGVQFHPEASPEIVSRWAAGDRERFASAAADAEITAAEARLVAGRGAMAAAARNAELLFDGFWDNTRRNGEAG